MLKLLLYGYANGVMSSRKLEAATYRDGAVRMLCAGQHPDYRSIARFRGLSELFVQSLGLCRKARLVGLGSLALDGTKLRAHASRHKAISYAWMVKKEAQLEAEIGVLRGNVERLLGEAERVDACTTAVCARRGAEGRCDGDQPCRAAHGPLGPRRAPTRCRLDPLCFPIPIRPPSVSSSGLQVSRRASGGNRHQLAMPRGDRRLRPTLQLVPVGRTARRWRLPPTYMLMLRGAVGLERDRD
jgi:Transposase domain (DUF772)